jgi:hypothetical protein
VDMLSESLSYRLQIILSILVQSEKKWKVICLIMLKEVADASLSV